MNDIYETKIVCPDCDRDTKKDFVVKEGFKIRTWKCPECGKVWPHPSDMKEYEDFNKLKQREFNVKLRMVGNSYAVSIPREIIQFEEEFMRVTQEMEREFERMVRLCLEEPGKLSLFFNREESDKKSDEEEDEVK